MALTIGTDEYAVVATIDPDAYTASTYTSDVIDMADYDVLMIVSLVGTTGGTVAVKVEQGTATAMSDAKDVTGAAITTINTSPVTAGGDSQQIINLFANALDIANNFRYVRVSFTGTGTNDFGCVVLGRARYKPASDSDLASVSEIVTAGTTV